MHSGRWRVGRWPCLEPMSRSSGSTSRTAWGTGGRRSGTCGSVERYRHGAGVALSGTVSAGGPIKNAPRGLGWRPRHLHLSRTAEEAEAGPASAQRITLPVADFLLQRGLHVPVPQTRVVRVLWAVSSDAHRGPWPSAARHLGSARRGPRESGPADAVCPAWGGPSRAVSHLWPAAVCTGVIPRGGAPRRCWLESAA